jgi:hypothetical protein
MIPQHYKDYTQQTCSQCYPEGEKQSISSKIRNETKVSTLYTLIQYSVLIRSTQGKRNKYKYIHMKGRS